VFREQPTTRAISEIDTPSDLRSRRISAQSSTISTCFLPGSTPARVTKELVNFQLPHRGQYSVAVDTGEGTISQYATKAGARYLIKYSMPLEDGTSRVVLRRGFATRKEAADALGDINAEIRRGSHVVPRKITTGEWLTQWLGRIAPGAVHAGELPQERTTAHQARAR
jgi:hypothetical protein